VRLLLDTYAVLWWLADDRRLSGTAREAISDAEQPLFSAGTMFEVSIKASLGKLDVPDGWIEELFSEGFGLLAITPAHASALRRLSYVKVDGRSLRDPFDRLLVAQAGVEGIPIVTRDSGIVAYGAPAVW
jgi:PIN domain nuclease of toxin-antitoxin system